MQRQAIVQLFNKANSRARWRRFVSQLTRRATRLQTLRALEKYAAGQTLSVQIIPLDRLSVARAFGKAAIDAEVIRR